MLVSLTAMPFDQSIASVRACSTSTIVFRGLGLVILSSSIYRKRLPRVATIVLDRERVSVDHIYFLWYNATAEIFSGTR